ncbi:protein suex-1 [Drosophila ficusphila]|uniref:protein suex-1 n=1 Tax=Drosophila ficusphila TaxID=30025 RepID=UPI0007E832EB|nr:protein suex-1 [Drosophila ficusphila]
MSKLVFLMAFVVLYGVVSAYPANEDAVPAITLEDVVDLGAQEAKEGERTARWLWGGWGGWGGGWNRGWGGGWNGGWNDDWNGGWNNGWRISYRPWRSSYWW